MRNLLVLCIVLLALPAAQGADVAEQQASALFDSHWQWRLAHQPEFATSIGDHRFDAALSDTSLQASRAAAAHHAEMLAQARALDREQLGAPAQLSLQLFIHDEEQALQAAAFYPYTVQPLTAYAGIHVTLPQMVAEMPFATETDYRNYVARLAALPQYVNGLIAQLRAAASSGWTTPKTVMAPVPAMLRQLRESAIDGPLGQPFRQIPASIDKPVREELRAAGMSALRTQALPALQTLEDFVRTEYLSAARDSIAASALPGGQAYYAFLVAANTGTDMSPAAVHALGLQEVERLKGEMSAAVARTGFSGSFAQFAVFANSDPRLFASSPEALLDRYRRLVARGAAGLPKLFATVPAHALTVKAAPALGAEERGAAWYDAGSAQRPAAFVVNTSRLNTRPLWETEALALHEGVPGHHLQVWLARSNSALPAFRRNAWYVGYGEGWGLYAESLGAELGFYRDAFSAFGQLNSALFRAARLVVDTGIHAMGWSRQQGLDYLNANTANSPADNAIEIDRYIAWPGQALGYTVGALKIRALRDKAQAALGEKFDVRAFHGAILDQGPLPLDVLEQQVDLWLEKERSKAVATPPSAPASGSASALVPAAAHGGASAPALQAPPPPEH